MENSNFKNVVFDIGNVIVIWSPHEIIKRTFGNNCEIDKLIQQIFQDDIWKQLNLGMISEHQAKIEYCKNFKFNNDQIDSLFGNIKETQGLINGTVELIKKLQNAGYKLYALSDNVYEIIKYLKNQYDFWKYFHGTIISYKVNALKPYPEIFEHLLKKYELKSSESIFIDDFPRNTRGAKKLGFTAIDFRSAEQCEAELRSLGLVF